MNLPGTDQASELVTIEDLRTAASTLLNEYELLYRDVDRLLEKVNLLIEGLSPPPGMGDPIPLLHMPTEINAENLPW